MDSRSMSNPSVPARRRGGRRAVKYRQSTLRATRVENGGAEVLGLEKGNPEEDTIPPASPGAHSDTTNRQTKRRTWLEDISPWFSTKGTKKESGRVYYILDCKLCPIPAEG